MITQVLAIYDKKAMSYMRLMNTPSVALVTRDLQDACNGGDTTMTNHPNDFVLCRFGSFDDNTGVFELLPMPAQILEVAALVQSPGGIDNPLS